MSRDKLPPNVDRGEVDSTGAIIAEHPKPEELEAIRKACVLQPTLQSDIILDYDPHWHNTAGCDAKTWKFIKISPFLIPRRLRVYPDYVKIFSTGMAIHEAGHVIFSKPLWNEYQHWAQVIGSPICHMVINVIEDSRIDHWVVNGVGGSIGLSFESHNKWMGRVWLYGLEKHLHSMKWSIPRKLTGAPPSGFMISMITMVGLYGQYGDNEKLSLQLMDKYFPNLKDKYWVDFAKAVRIIRDAGGHHSWKGSLEKDCQELFLILAKFALEEKRNASGGSGQSQSCNSCGQKNNAEKGGESESDAILDGPFDTIEDAESALKKSSIERRVGA